MQKCFPLNDKDYLADDMRLFHVGRSVGVINSTGNDFLTQPGTGMQITVGKGAAYLLTSVDAMGGIVYANTDNVTFPIEAADALLSRYDAIVIRYEKESNTCEMKVVKGTPASNPTRYQPERTATAYELVLKYVFVKNAIGSITDDLIEDAILDEEVCGIAVDTLANIPTQQYDNQIKEWLDGQQVSFDKWFESIKDKLGSDSAGNLQLQIDDINQVLEKGLFIV